MVSRAQAPPAQVSSGSGLVRQRRQHAGFLVTTDHVDPPLVTWFAGERRLQEQQGEPDRVRHRVHARAEAQHVGVVVLAGQERGLLVPGQRRPDPVDLVRGDLLTVAGPADHDRDAARVGGRGRRRAHDVGRVVITGVAGRRAAVDHVVPGRGHRLGHGGFQLEAGMIRSEVNAHARQSGTAPRSIEDRIPGPGALQFEEPVGRGGQQHAVPEPCGRLAARDRRDHRPEERRAVHGDDRRADLVADPVHAVGVADPQGLVILDRIHRVGERIRQARLGERGLDHGPVIVRRLLVVEPGAERGVERAENLGPEFLLCRDTDTHRSPALGQQFPVHLGQTGFVLVEHGQGHNMPARPHGPELCHFENPARSYPGPRADRVEPEVNGGELLLSHVAPWRRGVCIQLRAPCADNRTALRAIPPGMRRFAEPGTPGALTRPSTAGAGNYEGTTAVASNLTRDEAHDRGRLVDVRSYHVDLDLTGDDQVFTSQTTVTFGCSRPGAGTFIDLTAPAVTEIVLNGQPVGPEAFDGDRITLANLAADNELRVRASCAYSRNGEGLHRFRDPVDGGVYLYSDLETFDAHRVYACFDQPDLKATFEFTVTVPAQWRVISNMAPDVTGEPAGGRETARWHFPPSAVMSTYITAVAAGPYHHVQNEHDGIPLGLYCRQSLAQYLDPDEIFEVTRQGFDFFHQAFATRYPFGKYDQLFVPEYKAGAMENAGCVTFLEDYLFRSQVTDFRRQS